MMDVAAILAALDSLPLSQAIRASLFAFPLIEATHVIAITLVFGTIAIVDLRLLGVASGHRPFTRLAPEILKWTWIAFALAAVTGSLMFITNAGTYFHNLPFRLKMLFMLGAGINMAVFQFLTSTSVHLWDDRPRAPPAGRVAAILSLCLWIGVIAMGRLIGFTSTQKAEAAPPPAGVDFDDFLGGAPGGPPPSAPVAPK
ncbi:MAG TPA: DUF6644 family protein [Caulobacteraceae bacterium]|nr:DUF6644 family protein [Caulobacteraceae bacterium]